MLPLANPQPHHVHPASVRGPLSRHHLEIATVPAGSTRPGAKPSARRPPAASGGSVIAGPRGARHPPTRTHALGPGMGKRGSYPACSQPRHAQAREPQPHSVHPASVRGPWSATAIARCPLAGGPTAPHDPCLRKRRPFGRGGEMPPPLPFQERWAACPCPRPGLRLRTCALASRPVPGRGGHGTLEDGRGGGMRPKSGCNYLVRGYSPSMHFF